MHIKRVWNRTSGFIFEDKNGKTWNEFYDGVVVVATLVGAFMLFFICFALRMWFVRRYTGNLMISSREEVQSPPLYFDEQQLPDYEELIPAPVYINVTLTTELLLNGTPLTL